MKLTLAVLLLLAGCAGGDSSGDDGSARMRLNGSYTAFGVGALHR